jgi:hypothetical protein
MGNKYGARKIKDLATGDLFDSQKEFARWYALRHMERAGKIQDLKRQVKFELIPKQDGERACSYIADFQYYQDGNLVVEDCKGYRTADYKIKRKLMLWVHGIKVKET